MTHKEYNGWTNYETWLMALWIDTDEYQYATVREIAGECSEAHDLATRIQELMEADQPELTGLWADMLNSALSQVNWYEIAEHYDEDMLQVCSECDGTDDVETVKGTGGQTKLCVDCRDKASANEPGEDSITTTDHVHFYQYGKLVFTLDIDEDTVAGINRELERMAFWPDVYFISDHGNSIRIDLTKSEGN